MNRRAPTIPSPGSRATTTSPTTSQALLEDGDPRVLRQRLRNVATAVGGMAALARRTGLSRETLYRTLSERGNPTLDTLARVLAAFNLRLAVTRREPA